MRREATIAMRLQHANVCPILRLGETADRLLYLVMPYLEGEPLSEHAAYGLRIATHTQRKRRPRRVRGPQRPPGDAHPRPDRRDRGPRRAS